MSDAKKRRMIETARLNVKIEDMEANKPLSDFKNAILRTLKELVAYNLKVIRTESEKYFKDYEEFESGAQCFLDDMNQELKEELNKLQAEIDNLKSGDTDTSTQKKIDIKQKELNKIRIGLTVQEIRNQAKLEAIEYIEYLNSRGVP